MGNPQSTIKTLRELNSDLVHQIAELRKKFAEVETENIEIKAENAKVKAENIEIKVENTKLKQTLEEHETRFTKLECDISLIKEQNSQGIDTINSQNPINLQVPIFPKINSDNTLIKDISSYTGVNRLKAKSQPEIEHSSSSTQSESQITSPSIESRSDKETSIHCETNDSITSIAPEQIASQSEDVPASITPDITNSDIYQPIYMESKSLEDIEIDKFLDSENKKRVSNEIRQRNREEKLQCDSASQGAHSISQNTASTTSRERKNEQGLIREMISSKEEKHVTEISANLVRPNNETSITPPIPAMSQLPSDNGDIISLYKNACDAEIGAIEANREETLRWCFYAREFKSMYKDFMVSNKVGEKKAKEFTDDQDSSSDDLFETEVSIPTESIPLDLSQENNQDLELPEDEVNASTEETKSRVSDSSISANSETEVNVSNKSRLPISILPNNPEEKRKHVIKMVLERFTNLSFKRSSKYTDHFNCTETCPVCNEEHKDDNVSGEWGSGDYYGEETYRLYCRKVELM
ncbi:36751_t:CDS:2 [Gigaspora margarita]|uniref:36751_t:CDS:1 n=1 Tax=Gigaspora margarita TaxID=4874 RepID=A0ABN7VYJ6_GIGMA|nr:36751_t:CDS:2 [Gigaspora margarita]